MLEKFSFPLWEPVVWFGLINVLDQGLSAGALSIVKKHLNLTGTRGLIRALLFASAGLSLAMGLFAFSGMLWWAIALLLIIAVLRNIIYPLHTAWVNRKLEPEVRATILSLSGQVDAIGQIAGGPGVGLIARRISMPVGILTSALLLTPVLALLGRQYTKNTEDQLAESGGQAQ
jgi:DHA3 family tetracycline resistance protein-like MFS transporter